MTRAINIAIIAKLRDEDTIQKYENRTTKMKSILSEIFLANTKMANNIFKITISLLFNLLIRNKMIENANGVNHTNKLNVFIIFV